MNPMFYQNPVVLNDKEHKDWKIEAVEDYKFAKKTNSVYLMSAEFVLASKEYPVVFVRNNDVVTPIALLGIKDDTNQFVVQKGGWDADYIPAYVRRYPFIPATKEGSDELMLCIDADYKGLNTKKAKLSLLDKDGKPDVVTQQAINLLKSYNEENKVTTAFCQKLVDLDLLEEAEVGGATSKGEQVAMGGFMRVSQAKLAKLDAKTVKELFDLGALELIYAHFHSMDNLKKLA
jgi:hypothetical protein